MTVADRVELVRIILSELQELQGLNPVHKEYAQALQQRIDSEIVPGLRDMTENTSRELLEEILKVSAVIAFSKSRKLRSSRITKKSVARFFRKDRPLYEAFSEMKSSRYGLAMLNMNINRFLEIQKKV